jgi:hypothetical protein
MFHIPDDLKSKVERIERKFNEEVCNAQSALEEVDIRGMELRKLEYDFNKEIIGGARMNETGKIQAEVVERYFENRAKARNMLIEQLQLKDARLKASSACCSPDVPGGALQGRAPHAPARGGRRGPA